MTAYAIALGGAEERSRRYLAVNDLPEPNPVGWRPLKWTKDRTRADLFSFSEAADAYARSALGHDQFAVVIVPPSGRGFSPDGGTPVLMQAAA